MDNQKACLHSKFAGILISNDNKCYNVSWIIGPSNSYEKLKGYPYEMKQKNRWS